ncbi:MAG: hypothetical protein HFH60_03755 [Lachnospiraceae bacterium]|nr:hypothetical protein [Lachnospiraceae bacterium]
MKKLYTLIMALLLMTVSVPVYAADTSKPTIQHIGGTTLIGEVSDKISIEFSDKCFFEADIMNPGDTWESVISLKNTSKDTNIQVSLVEIYSLLKDSKLFDALDLKIYLGEDLAYSGDYSKTPTPVFNWIDVPAGSSVDLRVITHFPGECGNEYQSTPFKADWVFEARMAEKPVKEETPGKPTNETVKTGDEAPRSHLGWYGLGTAGVLASILLIGMKKNKKGDGINEK